MRSNAGLVNAHTHLPMTLLRGYADGPPYREWTEKIRKAETKLTPEDIKAGARLGVLEMIKSGTTSFADMYIHMDEVAKVVEETGIRAALGYGMIEGLNEDSETKLKNREEICTKMEWRSTWQDHDDVCASFGGFLFKRIFDQSQGTGQKRWRKNSYPCA